MNDSLNFFIMFFLLLTIAVLGGVLGGILNQEHDFIDKLTGRHYKPMFDGRAEGIEGLNTTSLDDIINDCNNGTIRIDKRLKCVQAHVDRFFTYKIRPDNETISFTELMYDGGDCGNWADFWKYVGDKLGYDTTDKRIIVDDKTAHRFAVISNKQGYCIADQKNLNCFIYG